MMEEPTASMLDSDRLGQQLRSHSISNPSSSSPSASSKSEQEQHILQSASPPTAALSSSIFSDLPLSALTSTSSSSGSLSSPAVAAAAAASNHLTLLQRPPTSTSTSSASTSASVSPLSSPNVSRASSIGQSHGGATGTGSGRIRPGLLSRAGTDPDGSNLVVGSGSGSGNTNGNKSEMRPLSNISKGLPSSLMDGGGMSGRSKSAAVRSTSASEDDEARLSDSGIIPRRFADLPSGSNSSLNVGGSSVNSAPAATTSLPQRSATASSSYSGYSASSSRNSSPLVSPAGSISAARARQVFASPTSSPISATNGNLPSPPTNQNFPPNFTPQTHPQHFYPNDRQTSSSAGGHASETSSFKSKSASLGRAQSVSSVSSVNSTSSLEAAPFRAAPLGNFRVGFGGYGRTLGGYGNANSTRRPQIMERDKTLSGSQVPRANLQSPRAGMPIGTGGESSAAESEDGGNELAGSGDGESSNLKGKRREDAASSSLAGPFSFDSSPASTSQPRTTPNTTSINGLSPTPPPRKQSHTPKLPSDAWQYRNAPGMGGSRHNSAIPASWGLAVASGASGSHHRGANSLSLPQSNTWSSGNSSSATSGSGGADLGNEELLAAPPNSNSASQSPSRKHPNPSTFRSKLVKSASKLGIKPLSTTAAGGAGSGGSSPASAGYGGRPFVQLEGEPISENGNLKVDTSAQLNATSSGGLLVPGGGPLSPGGNSTHSGDSTLGLAGLVGIANSSNSQDDSTLPMIRTSSVTNAPLFATKHGDAAGTGGVSFNSGGVSPIPSPGIPAYVNVNNSKSAFGVWAFGVPELRVSPKEERETLVPTMASNSLLSISPGTSRSNGTLSQSSLAALAPSSPMRTPNSVLSVSPSSSRVLNSTPPLAVPPHSSPETPTTPLSKATVLSNVTPISTKKMAPPLTPAQQVRAEVEAGTARAPSEPSGHTPGPTPVLPPVSSSSRERSSRSKSSNRERERSFPHDQHIKLIQQSPSHPRTSQGPAGVSASPTVPSAVAQFSGSEGTASQPTSRDVSKTRVRERTNSSNLKSQPPSISGPVQVQRSESFAFVSASAPSSPRLQSSKFNVHGHSNSSGNNNANEGSAISRGRVASTKGGSSGIPGMVPERPSFLRALTSESIFSNRSTGGKSSISKNDSVLSGESSYGSGSTSRPAVRKEEDGKAPSALARLSQKEDSDEEQAEEEEQDLDRTARDQDYSKTNQDSTNSVKQREHQLDLSNADSIIAERRPLVEESIDLPVADPGRRLEEIAPESLEALASSEVQESSEVAQPAAALSSPTDSSASDLSKTESSARVPPTSFGPSETQAKSEAKAQAEAQTSSVQPHSRALPPPLDRAESSISTSSNAISTSSVSIAPVSIKAPARKAPGIYVPHADASMIGNSIGRRKPVEGSGNMRATSDGTAPSSTSSGSSDPSPPAQGSTPTSAAISTPVTAPPAARKTAAPATTGASSSVAPRTARGPKDFEFGEILGEGSYSTVLEAWDLLSGPSTTTDGSAAPVQSTTAAAAAAGKTPSSSATASRAGRKMYAVKVLDKMHILKEKKQKYVNVEREALSLLVKHPGVISLYWTFQDRESLYFVLQLAQNGELLNFIKKHGSFDSTSSRYYAAQLLDTIGAMHRVGVIHRDIKPENVLLDGAMRIKVTDFGSAKISSVNNRAKASANPSSSSAASSDGPAPPTKERANSFVGTAEYVSPELLGGKTAAEASDFWAFGCVLYQMIAGRPPFKGANEYQTFQKIIKREFEFPEEFPANARDLVDRLLVLEPEERLGFKEGVEEIKKHAFFAEMDFDTVWSIPAPPISTGICQRPASSIRHRNTAESLHFGSDGWVDQREAGSLLSERQSSLAPSTGNAGDDSRAASISSADQNSSPAPGRSAVSVVEADDSDSDAQAGPRRARGLSTGEGGAPGLNGKRASNLMRLATAVTGKEWSATVGARANRSSQRASVIPPNVRQQLKHRFSSNSVNASSSSVDDFDQDDTPTRGNPPRRRHGSAVVPAVSTPVAPSSTVSPPVVGWAGLLLPHEVLLYACPIIHRKTGTANMFSKKRLLILTDFPRLLCVKETADALKVKSEVILTMPPPVESPTSPAADTLAPLSSTNQASDLVPLSPSQTPSRIEAKRRASHSAEINSNPIEQYSSNVSAPSPRGIPARRESWSANSLAVGGVSSRGASPDPEREKVRALMRANANAAPNMLVGVEARGNRAFVVHTPARSYLYEDPSGDSSNWIKVINSARAA